MPFSLIGREHELEDLPRRAHFRAGRDGVEPGKHELGDDVARELTLVREVRVDRARRQPGLDDDVGDRRVPHALALEHAQRRPRDLSRRACRYSSLTLGMERE